MVAMSVSSDEMQFYSQPGAKVGKDFFTSNGEWELIDSSTVISNLSAGGTNLSSVD
ncbi:neuronal acetylcholine receptor subunit alpha-6, partial [Biomphalaria pfeifferi]